MLINNPDALKSWLVVVLEPLCDADSSALARYVLALLKKDKPEKELKKVMIEQLDVFLGEETMPFVERLFDAISTEEYLNAPATLDANSKLSDMATNVTIIACNASAAKVTATDAVVINAESIHDLSTNSEAKMIDTPSSSAYVDKIQTPPIDEHKTKDNSSNNHKFNEIAAERSATYAIRPETTSQEQHNAPYTGTGSGGGGGGGNNSSNNHVRSASPPARANADKENQPRESRRRRASLRSRSRSPRSRSRSNDRLSRRSRSRDRRANEREKNQRQFRNKSPPSSSDMRQHERRRGGGGGPERRRIGGSNNMGPNLLDDRSPRFVSGSGEVGAGRKGGARVNRSNSRSRSPSVERGRSKASPGLVIRMSARASPERNERHHHVHAIQHENHEKRQRCRDFDEKGYCVRGETCPWDHGVNPVVFEGINNPALISMSLREYNPDAPDLWTRSASTGGMVGATPNAITAGLAGGASINPFTGTPRPGSVMAGMCGPGAVGFPHLDKATNGAPGALTAADYVRNAATGVGGFRGAAAPMIPFPFNPAAVTTPLQRELIPIPVVDANAGAVGGDISAMQQNKRRFEMEDSVAIAEGPTKRKVPLNSRLGPRMPSIQNNCSLELRKVPRGLNTIAHLNNHFAKFGKIVNIQISYDGDPEAAIVTFSTHAEANVAYRSTEAVLNNRFIKVFWHSQDPNTGGGGSGAGGVGDGAPLNMSGGRKNSQYHLHNVPAIPTPNADSAKTSNTVAAAAALTSQNTTLAMGNLPTAGTVAGASNDSSSAATSTNNVIATHVPPPSLRLKNNVTRSMPTAASSAIIRKKQEEQAKAVVQLANGLRKRKQELLQSYVKQMKSALELVERCEPNDPQRNNTLETIKVLQETIDKLRKEIAAEQEQIQAQIQSNQPPPPKKTKEQQKKELLDIELELIAQQQEGNDITAIQKRLEDLQRSLGIAPGSGGVGATGGALLAGSAIGSTAGGKGSHFLPAGGRANARGRTNFPEGSTRVDRRPKTIVVTGFTGEEADFVLGHFKHFGEITKHDVDKDIPQLILSYATRINAEQAVLRGKLFKDKRLQISWAPVVQALLTTCAGKKSPSYSPTNVDALKSKNGMEKSNSESEGNAADTLPELRLEDEEEDEESEDRSWRR